MQIEISDEFYSWLENSKDLFRFSSHEEVLMFYLNRYMGKIKMRDSKQMDISFEIIFNTIAEYYNVSLEFFMNARIGNKKVKQARFIARHIAKQIKGCSNSEIARYLKKDPSAISHTLTLIEQRIKENPELQREVSEIITLITSTVKKYES